METNDSLQEEMKKECCISDSELCYWIGNKGCSQCYINSIKDDDEKEKALRNWRVMLSNLPKNIDSLHESEKCLLCKGEILDRTCYASVDMAHPEPKSMKGMFFGLGKKVRVPVGSITTLHLASCSKCRKRYLLTDIILWFFLLGFLAASFVLVSIPALASPLLDLNELFPILFVVIMGVVGYFIGKKATDIYRMKAGRDTKFDLQEIPEIKQMFEKGWYFFQDNKGEPKLFFKTKKNFCRLFPESYQTNETLEKQT